MDPSMTRAQMEQLLRTQTRPGETLEAAVYGGLRKQGGLNAACIFGYWGLTSAALLFAVPCLRDPLELVQCRRFPLPIRALRVRRTLLSRQYILRIQLTDGQRLTLRMAPRLLGGWDDQHEAITAFLAGLERHIR